MFGYKLISEEEFNNLAALVGDQATTICSLHEELNRMEREKHNHRAAYYGAIKDLNDECAELRNTIDFFRSSRPSAIDMCENSEDVFARWQEQNHNLSQSEIVGSFPEMNTFTE